MNRLLLIGGGGHCRSVLDSVQATKEYDEIGIIDNTEGSILSVPIIGNDSDIQSLFKEGWTNAFVTVGSVGDIAIRKKLYEMLKEIGLNISTIIDPTAIVAKGATIGEGVFIGKRAVVNSCTSIGECAIINTGAIVEHDCQIGKFVHISPGAVLCGNVSVGDGAHIGAGAIVRQQIMIGNESLIGAGSIVVKDIPNKKKAMGNPCRVVEK